MQQGRWQGCWQVFQQGLHEKQGQRVQQGQHPVIWQPGCSSWQQHVLQVPRVQHCQQRLSEWPSLAAAVIWVAWVLLTMMMLVSRRMMGVHRRVRRSLMMMSGMSRRC